MSRLYFYLETNAHIAAQASLKLTVEPRQAIPLPQSSKWWNYRCEPSCLIVSVVSFWDIISWCYYLGCPRALNPPASAHWALSYRCVPPLLAEGFLLKLLAQDSRTYCQPVLQAEISVMGASFLPWLPVLLILKETPDSLGERQGFAGKNSPFKPTFLISTGLNSFLGLLTCLYWHTAGFPVLNYRVDRRLLAHHLKRKLTRKIIQL